jgi:hypothetical protein
MDTTMLTHAPYLSDLINVLLGADPELASRRVQELPVALTESQSTVSSDPPIADETDEDAFYWDQVVPLALEDLLEGEGYAND